MKVNFENKGLIYLLPKRIFQILIVTFLSLLIDFVPAVFQNTSPIWMGEAVEVTGGIILGPLVGGIAAFIKSVSLDYWIYGSFEYLSSDLTAALTVFFIALLYKRLCPEEDRFGVKEIVVFNFVQVIINIGISYFLTAPITVLFLDSMVVSWEHDVAVEALEWMMGDTFTGCVSVAILGTTFMAFAMILRNRRKRPENGAGKISGKTFIRRAYTSRAAEFSLGIFLAIVLGLVDSILSGHLLGRDALAAISVTIPMVALAEFFSVVFVNGCTTMCSMAHGNKEYKKADQYFTLGLILTIVMGLLQLLGFWALRDLYFQFFNPSESIRVLAEEYYGYFMLVPPVLGLTRFLDEAVSSDGDDLLSNSGYLVSFGLNLVFSYILTKHLGICGLALGTLISYCGYVLLECLHFLKKSNTYHLSLGFSLRDIPQFFKYSLSNSFPVLCKALVSAAFTKAIINLLGSEYLIANTVLCAMLEVYELVNGPSEAAYYIMSTYSGERNGRGLKEIFAYAMWVCLGMGFFMTMLIVGLPELVLYLFDISDSPIHDQLISCIRYCAIGITAASFTGFLNDYYGATGKSYWAALITTLKTVLLPVLFSITFCVTDGIQGMGKGMLLSQVMAVAIFFGFLLILKGSGAIPYMIDEKAWERVESRNFSFAREDYEGLLGWIKRELLAAGADEEKIRKAEELLENLYRGTVEKNREKKVLGECVLVLEEKPAINIKDDGELFEALEGRDNTEYNVLLTANCNRILL